MADETRKPGDAVKLDQTRMSHDQLIKLGMHHALFDASSKFAAAAHKTILLTEKQVYAKVARILHEEALLIANRLADELRKQHPDLDKSAHLVTPGDTLQ